MLKANTMEGVKHKHKWQPSTLVEPYCNKERSTKLHNCHPFSKNQPILVQLAEPATCSECTRFPRYHKSQMGYNSQTYPNNLKDKQQAFDNSNENASKFSPTNDNVFARIASRYDLICNLFSFGLHHLWKRRFIEFINKERWHNLLDIASGTGEIAHKLLTQHPEIFSESTDNQLYTHVADKPLYSFKTSSHCNTPALPQIIISDLSDEMVHAARLKLNKYQRYLKFMVLDAHDLTNVASNSQDVVSISMGLKLLNRQKALTEVFRVLKPNGRLISIEVSIIPIAWLHKCYLKALSIIIPIIANLTAAKDRSVYRYLLQGIRDIPTANKLAKEIEDIGFVDVAFERLTLGVVAIHSARKT